MMFENKRGQAAGAAVLLVVIAALLVMFVVLIPPEDRAELLGDNDTNTVDYDDEDYDIDDAVPEKNMLKESPGRIDYLEHDELEHPLPVVNIFTRTESKILGEKNLVYAKKGVFSEEKNIFKFSVPDLINTEEIILGYNVETAEGKLVIHLNGEQVFNGEVGVGSSSPIKFSKTQLAADNELIFTVSSPGLAFWATNELVLNNVKVVADVTSKEAQKSKNVFLVSDTEKTNLEKVILKFQPECKYGEVGMLSILINNFEIYKAIPDCDLAMVPIEFSSDLIHQGENEVVFSTNSGTYILSHVMIISELKDLEFPTYYFELSHEQYGDIRDEDRRLRLEMDFVDVVSSKFGTLYYNGHAYHFDTREANLAIDLSDDVVQGYNSLKIKPQKTIDVRQIRVDIVK
jgi:hypothetical protein